MAVPAPASITVGDVIRGEEVTISWSAVPDTLGYMVERSLNGAAFGNIPQYDIINTVDTYITAIAEEDWNTVQYRVKAFKYEGDFVGAMLEYSDWTTSEVKTAQTATPPTPSTGGARLEQFQNSDGTNIYPRTVMEGVVRRSDGKSLKNLGVFTDGGAEIVLNGNFGSPPYTITITETADGGDDGDDENGGETSGGGTVSLENVVTVSGGAKMLIDEYFGGAPYTIKIIGGGTPGSGDSPVIPDQPESSETTLPSTAYWNSVTFGSGKFVAIAYGSNKAAYSTDGINWVAAALPSSADWYSVAYGDGKFVAVEEYSNKAAYSTDGIHWAAATLPASVGWRSVTYGNGKFVAVANGTNDAAYSNDGINWTKATMPSIGAWWGVTYGNGKFVAVSSNSSKAAYSSDGVTWTETTLPASASWQSVAYGGGKFVAVAYNSDKAAYSTDGITWTAATLPSSDDWYSVAYGDGKFVAVANDTTAAYSTDGINWVAAALPSSADWYSITYGNGKFVAVANNSDKAVCFSPGNMISTQSDEPETSTGPLILVNDIPVAGLESGGQGPAGPGVPTGGTTGQALVKDSGTNYDTAWKTLFTYGTTDLTAGSSSLPEGQIHLVYE